MKAVFPYIGESVLREILSRDPYKFLALFREMRYAKIDVLMQIPLAFPKTDIKFDGFQKLDLGLLLDRSELLPIEVKLGKTGLYRANIDFILKTGCKISAQIVGHHSAKFQHETDVSIA